MYKAYKFRVYPSVLQKEIINKSLGCSRFVFNHYLAIMKDSGYMNAFACIKDYVEHLKYEYSFLTEVDSIIIRKSLFHLDDAFQRFFKRQGNYPKFKSRFSNNSYNTSAIYGSYKGNTYCNIEIDFIKRMIKLPKLKWMKFRGYRNLENLPGKIINATISKEDNGKYYVSIACEISSLKDYHIIPTSIVGLDLGIKKLITLSDSKTFDNNKYILKYEKQIKRCQRSLSRKEKCSKNYYKCKQKLAKLYSKLKNARKYYIHSITKKITDNYDIIVTELLSSKHMLKDKNLSKSIQDTSFYEIIRQLHYKSSWKGKYFYQIDKYYPSSQTCSVCSHIDKKYKDLNKRLYECSNCYQEIDRDLNASINIMFEGLKLHMKNSISVI